MDKRILTILAVAAASLAGAGAATAQGYSQQQGYSQPGGYPPPPGYATAPSAYPPDSPLPDFDAREGLSGATLVALFPIISNTILGLRSVNPGLLNLFRLNRANRWQVLGRLRIPSALPYFFGGLRISSGLALIGAVVAEFVSGSGATQGLAWRLLEAGNRLRTAELLAALVCLAILGLLLNAATTAIQRRVLASRVRGWCARSLAKGPP